MIVSFCPVPSCTRQIGGTVRSKIRGTVMGKQVHRIQAFESRKVSHPVFETINKYWLTVKATDFPQGMSSAANAREPVGLNRMVYKDVKASLEGKEAIPGSFDLMNKGITVLAISVRLVDKDENIFEIIVDDKAGGIVDGAHRQNYRQV
jgi:hypothetical protein